MLRHTGLFFLVLAATPALADTRDDVYSASQRCAAITDDRTWLQCYYGAAQPMRSQLQLPPAPASQTSLIPPPTQADAARQQVLHPAPPKPGPIARTLGYLAGGADVISNVPIQSYQAGPDGFTVVLANGQVWKQTDDQTRTVRWRDGAEAHHVTIRKGALDSLSLAFDNENLRYKVRRVK